MAAGVGVGVGASELVAGAVDDFLGESAGGCDCAAGGNEDREARGALWAVFGGGVCDCVGAGELFAAAIGVNLRGGGECGILGE